MTSPWTSDRGTETFRKPDAFDVVVLAITIGLGLALPLWRGVGPVPATVGFVGATALGVALTFVPRKWRGPADVAALLTGIVVISVRDLDGLLNLSWGLGTMTGLLVGLDLRWWPKARAS